MGVSTDGQIDFGVVFAEGEVTLPWDDEETTYEGEYEEWWRHVSGFEHKLPDPFDASGNWKADLDTKEKQDAAYEPWSAERAAFDKEHPFPFSITNYCSGECPMYILSIVSVSNNRGYPVELDFDGLKGQVTEEKTQELLDFCKEHELEFESGPDWFLTSCWD